MGMVAHPLLVVEHEAQCPPGWLGEWLVEAGARLHVCRPYLGDRLPADLTAYAGMLVLGGAMGANDDDDHPWLAEVRALIAGAARERTPVLGVCLGHQLAAVALGGSVDPNPLGSQVGVLEIGWVEGAADDELLGEAAGRPTPARALQWNDDVVTSLPPGAVLLARTARDEVQAARLAPSVWGIQWHPEVDEQIIATWAENDRDAAEERGLDVDGLIHAVAGARADLHRTWGPLARRFARLCDRHPSQADAR